MIMLNSLKGQGMNSKECKNCVFFKNIDITEDGASYGQCRIRSPMYGHEPVAGIVETDKLLSIWPLVYTDSWCGEFKENSSKAEDIVFDSSEFCLSSRIIGIFQQKGIRTVSDIMGFSKSEIRKWRGFGITSQRELFRKLGDKGILLKD